MIVLMYCMLCLAGSRMAVFMDGLDCNLDCECCKGGVARCKDDVRKGDNYCLDGCIDGIYGLKCRNLCRGNCLTCEQIYGKECYSCKDTFYGIDVECNKSCTVGCVGGVCIANGTCNLCSAHFEEITCSECQSGYYGENCNNICSVGCTTSSCDRSNGFCKCLPYFSGDKCDKCISGLYGQACDLHCSDNCKGDTCSRFQGKCTHGCVDGYSGDNCTTPCNNSCATCQQYDKSQCLSCYNGYSGSTCQCLPNCICDFASDICTKCKHGYSNPDRQCECQSNHCIDAMCDKCVNQTFYVDSNACCNCPDTCKGGTCRAGPECISGCIDGFYGLDCSQSCLSINSDCLRCIQTDGKCIECHDGVYPNGNGSCVSCNGNCKNQQCNSETGACINGCEGRFWGEMCDIQCGTNCKTCQQVSGICDACFESPPHGSYCNESCSSSCLDSKCEHTTGYCSNGCSIDFYGNLCNMKCPDNCKQGETNPSCNTDGECIYGCINGLEGTDCTKRRIYVGSSTILGLAVLSGALGILFICIAAGCHIWNRRRPKQTEQRDRLESEMTYEQLQRRANDPKYMNVDDNYTVLSM